VKKGAGIIGSAGSKGSKKIKRSKRSKRSKRNKVIVNNSNRYSWVWKHKNGDGNNDSDMKGDNAMRDNIMRSDDTKRGNITRGNIMTYTGNAQKQNSIYAYCRVSTEEQKTDRQVDDMLKRGIPKKNIFVEKCSGTDFDRPVWLHLLTQLKSGDTLIIQSIDRFGRNYQETVRQLLTLKWVMHVKVVVLADSIFDAKKEKSKFEEFISDIMMFFGCFMAESEYDNIKNRQKEGIAAAKARGVRFGRPRKEAPHDFNVIVQRWEGGEIRLDKALKQTGLKRTTFFMRLREYRRDKAA